MNIFIVSKDPIAAARMLCDRHIVNQPRESCVMLCNGWPDGAAPYKKGWTAHPCTVWTLENRSNYSWHLHHAMAMCDEYSYRYGKTHYCESVLEWCKDHYETLSLPLGDLTRFYEATGDVHLSDPVASYREYIRKYKMGFSKWTRRPQPDWTKR